MSMGNMKRVIGGAGLTLVFLFSVIATAGVTAQAQYRDDRQIRQERRERMRERRERIRERRDRVRDDRYRRDGSYGAYGNNRGYGTYGNNGGYGTYGGYNNNVYRVALEQGYRNGMNTGASDADRGQSYNPQRSHYYKEGDEGYSSPYGNRNQYRQAYREGFLRGYQEGYRQYGGYNRGNQRNRAGSILGQIFGRP